MLSQPDHQGPIVGIAHQGQFLGWQLLADTLRPEALQELKQMGIDMQLLLTGDRLAAGQSVADKLGIQDVFAQALPATTLQEVQKAVNKGWRPLRVSDGNNDALAVKAGPAGSRCAQTTRRLRCCQRTSCSQAVICAVSPLHSA